MLRDWKPGLEFLKFQQQIEDLRDRKYRANACARTILRLVLIGWMEYRPYDLSSLSFYLGFSRATTTRRVNEIASQGWIKVERRGQSRKLLPTQALINLVSQDFMGPVQAMLERYDQIFEMIQSEPISSKQG